MPSNISFVIGIVLIKPEEIIIETSGLKNNNYNMSLIRGI